MGELDDILEQFLVAEPPLRENNDDGNDRARSKKYKFPRRNVDIPNYPSIKNRVLFQGTGKSTSQVNIAPSLKEWIKRYGAIYGYRLEEDLVNEAVSMLIGLISDDPYLEAQELQ